MKILPTTTSPSLPTGVEPVAASGFDLLLGLTTANGDAPVSGDTSSDSPDASADGFGVMRELDAAWTPVADVGSLDPSAATSPSREVSLNAEPLVLSADGTPTVASPGPLVAPNVPEGAAVIGEGVSSEVASMRWLDVASASGRVGVSAQREVTAVESTGVDAASPDATETDLSAFAKDSGRIRFTLGSEPSRFGGDASNRLRLGSSALRLEPPVVVDAEPGALEAQANVGEIPWSEMSLDGAVPELAGSGGSAQVSSSEIDAGVIADGVELQLDSPGSADGHARFSGDGDDAAARREAAWEAVSRRADELVSTDGDRDVRVFVDDDLALEVGMRDDGIDVAVEGTEAGLADLGDLEGELRDELSDSDSPLGEYEERRVADRVERPSSTMSRTVGVRRGALVDRAV